MVAALLLGFFLRVHRIGEQRVWWDEGWSVWAARFPVADVYRSQFFHSRAIVKTPTAVTNFSHCKVADAEIDAARSETDKAKQVELWKAAQKKIIEEVCAVPVNEMMQLWAYKDSLDLGYELKASLNLGPPVLETTRFTK